jgi:hypothetical protein
MITRRARSRDSIARVACFGALALAIAFGALALDSVATAGRAGDAQHAVVIPHDARPTVVVANSSRSRGGAWFASLFSACALMALAGYVLGTDRKIGYRCNAAQFSIRLRAPPSLHVAL